MKIVWAIVIGLGLGFLSGSILADMGMAESRRLALGLLIIVIGAILILVSFA